MKSKKMWWLNEESQQVLNRGYLLKGETVQDAIERIVIKASSYHNGQFKEEFRELIERGYMSLSSPIWSNCGTQRGLPISCFNVHVPDSIEGITTKTGEVIMQTKIGGGTSGYFGELRGRGASITDNGKSSGAVSFMELFNTSMNVVSQGSCYQEGTKVLTQRGYVDFREVKETDLLSQVDEHNKVSFTKDYELVVNHFKGKLVKIKGKKRDDLVNIGVTPNHRMVIERRKGTRKNGKYWAGNTEIVKAEDLRLHRDNRMFFAGNTELKGRGLTTEERFMIAFQADGRKDYKCNTARFRFKKERKIERLIEIVENLGVRYETKVEKNGVTNIYVYNSEHLKKEFLDWIDLSQVSLQWCEEFIEEISLWDGSKNKNRTSIYYSSIHEQNVNMVQSIASICGKRTRLRTEENREGNRKDLYSITISDINKIQGDSCEIYREDYDGNIYCAVVPKGRLIVSFDGRTLVCGNTRRGAFAAYLDIDHPDIEEFLKIKSIGHTIQNLFYGVCIPDYWMQEMENGDMNKRQIWAKVLESRQEKGLPYLFFTDNVNRNKPEIYKKTKSAINSSNLCSEIALPSNKDESFVCCLASMNLELYDEWKDTKAVKYAIYFLDAIMSEFIEKTKGKFGLKQAHNFAKRHRALGLGVLGYHSYLQKNNIAFSDGMRFNNESFALIERESKKASKELAEIHGHAPIFDEVDGIEKFRNTTTMAIAPTTSSSAILGQVSAGIEPYSSNYYKAGLSKGNFMRKNKYLDALLTEKGINNEDTWRKIMLDGGSVQGLSELNDAEKAVFMTFKEINQRDILNQAVSRQRYIDQSQSLNINIPSDIPIKEVNKLILDFWKSGGKTLYYQRSQSVSKELITNLVSCSNCES